MQKIFTQSIPNHEASRQLAQKLCKEYLVPNQPFTLFLEGGLGAGKTFLAKEILAIMGVKDEVSSPTYALVNEYSVAASPEKGRSGGVSVSQSTNPLNPPSQREVQHYAHWDFYRLEDADDFFARGFQDLAGEDGVCHLVEWPERLNPEAKASFDGTRFVLKLEFGIGVGMRKVKLLQG